MSLQKIFPERFLSWEGVVRVHHSTHLPHPFDPYHVVQPGITTRLVLPWDHLGQDVYEPDVSDLCPVAYDPIFTSMDPSALTQREFCQAELRLRTGQSAPLGTQIASIPATPTRRVGLTNPSTILVSEH
jgi:hypothetical protein